MTYNSTFQKMEFPLRSSVPDSANEFRTLSPYSHGLVSLKKLPLTGHDYPSCDPYGAYVILYVCKRNCKNPAVKPRHSNGIPTSPLTSPCSEHMPSVRKYLAPANLEETWISGFGGDLKILKNLGFRK